MCQSTFAIMFCQRNCVFLCKGTKLQNSAKPNSGIVCRFTVWLPLQSGFAGFFMEESCFCFGKAGETSLLKKREKSRERGFGIEIPPVLCKFPVPKLQNSAKPNSGIVCRFTVWLPLQPWFAKKTAFFSAKAQRGCPRSY